MSSRSTVSVGWDVAFVPVVVAMIYSPYAWEWRQRLAGVAECPLNLQCVEREVRLTFRVKVHKVFLNVWRYVDSATGES